MIIDNKTRKISIRILTHSGKFLKNSNGILNRSNNIFLNNIHFPFQSILEKRPIKSVKPMCLPPFLKISLFLAYF